MWIKSCVSSTTLSLLINGSSTSDFQVEKGLRQGDPLSPLLFNIVAEGLNILLKKAKMANLISGVQMGSNGPVISHLQFVDDTMLFCKNNLEELKVIKGILLSFELMSGLKINFAKSQICGIGISEEEMKTFADVFKCKVVCLPIKYLGLPLGADPKRIATWQPVIEKVGLRLALWKRKYMSMGARVSLVRSTLGHLPQYYMSIFKMPITVCNKIEKIQRQFLWGDTNEKRKLHMVGWDRVTKSRKHGGLGIKKLDV